MNGVVGTDAARADGSTSAPRRAQHDPRELAAALEAFPEELGRAVAGHPDEALSRPGRDGGWGVVEILSHLRDWEEIFLARVRAVLAEDRPALPAYDDELWAVERDYRAQDPRQAYEQFRALRAELVEVLRDLPPTAWERVGEHSAAGPVSLRWLAAQIHEHDCLHLDQIQDVLA